jgi:hypothetical protein
VEQVLSELRHKMLFFEAIISCQMQMVAGILKFESSGVA